MSTIWEFIVRIIKLIFGVQDEPIVIGDHCYMPLFYRNLTHGIDCTWNYLAKSDAEKLHLRDYIKNGVTGETPAISFCLTPSSVSGGLIDDQMLAVTDGMLDYLEAKCKELVREGIAVFPCLYVDDKAPRWFAIESHVGIWARIHARIKNYVTGYILSIETNEEANSVDHIQGCIAVMRNTMPGVAWYGTHLDWSGKGRYVWHGGVTTPSNANIILAEYWDPHQGDSVGVQAFKNRYFEISRACPTLKWVSHEYNINPGSATCEAQKAFLRQQNAWGVG